MLAGQVKGLIAAGQADLYPRIGTTMEWDTAAGHAVLVHTDSRGNFFVRAQTATAANLTFPANAGVRDAANTKLMVATLPNGDCNNATCHGGTQGFIHLP